MVASSSQEASMSCESEVSVRNDYALRFWVISKPPPTVEYVKAISALIGASHILAIFEEDETIKVFFDDRRYVDTLIKKGIHVLGHHVRADFVVPPGIKVILSNVDPVISNYDLTRLLAVYGSIVSPVVRHPICDEVEFCHIMSGVRYVYMVLEGVLPSRLEVRQDDEVSYIKIEIEDNTNDIPVKSDQNEESDIEAAVMNNASVYRLSPMPNLQSESSPIVVSVQTASDEGPGPVEKNPEPASEDKSTNVNRCNPLLRKTFHKRLKRAKRLTSATQAAKRITQNVKHKWGIKRGPYKKKAKRGRPPIKFVPKKSPTSSSSDADPEAMLFNPVVRISPSKHFSYNYPLDDHSLRCFLDEVKHQRAPLELARKYLGENSGTVKVSRLIDQLYKFAAVQNAQSFKLRIGRLIKSLKEAIAEEKDTV